MNGTSGKLNNLRRRLKQWIKPKKQCHSCCLWCKHFEHCSADIESMQKPLIITPLRLNKFENIEVFLNIESEIWERSKGENK